MDNEAKLVLFSHFPDKMEAHIVSSVLETHGIKSFVFGHNASGISDRSVHSPTRLMVSDHDYDRAKEILADEARGL